MITIYTYITWIILFFYWFLIFVIILRLFIKKNTVPAFISWLLIIYIFPLAGILFYLLFEELSLERYRIKRSKTILLLTVNWLFSLKNMHQWSQFFYSKNSEVARSVFKLCENFQGFSGINGNKIKLLTNSKKIMKMLIKDIEMANNNIEMIFYIWFPGGMADDVAKSLISASKRGINCRIILDSAGSITFFKSTWFTMMYKAGIKIVEALKINFKNIFFRRMDLRQHRKVILIDNYIAYTGSMNLIDPSYFKQNYKIGKWVDLMVRMKGPIATTLGCIFSYDWAMETGKQIFPSLPNDIVSNFVKHHTYHSIQIIASGPGCSKNLIHKALLTAIYSARVQLTMTTPYFVPSDDLLHAICNAAHRGVDVNLILPHNNDSILVRWASRFFFDELLESGVKIYQYQTGLLHSKSVLIDHQLSLIGTVNLDIRSLWLNFEITLVIDDKKFGKNLSYVQKDYINHSQLLNKKNWSKRCFAKKIFERLCYFFNPFL